jgi:hypothetical protein
LSLTSSLCTQLSVATTPNPTVLVLNANGSVVTGTCLLETSEKELRMINSTNLAQTQAVIASFSEQPWTILTYTPYGKLTVYGPYSQLYEKTLVSYTHTATDSVLGPLTYNATGNILTNGGYTLNFDKATGALTLVSASARTAINPALSAGSYEFRLNLNGSYQVVNKATSKAVFSEYRNTYLYPPRLSLLSTGLLSVTDSLGDPVSLFYPCNVSNTSGVYQVAGTCSPITCSAPCATCINLATNCSSCVANARINVTTFACECEVGRYLDGSACVVCPAGCYRCESASVCTSCFAGFYFKANLCVAKSATFLNSNSKIVLTRYNLFSI